MDFTNSSSESPQAHLAIRSPELLISFTASRSDNLLECSKHPLPYHHHLPNLERFISDIFHKTHLSPCVSVIALIYLERLKSMLPERARGEFDTPYKVFLASILVASKFCEDVGLTNRVISEMTRGLYTIQQLNAMERSFLYLIKYNLKVDYNDVDNFVQRYGDQLDLEWQREMMERCTC
ncbi:hypothetical protein BZG36_01764 [Bifiguratus adelaidae]|uniref:Cyclin N-terminal domain-containing protein n=1 Tax=Bifiguratus adelaidae TaxID=1938954 RepID=A0A261Y3B8_9FUNG|nr:hypothetical protein BZG36_01764 [Bifiguratus adelaidae]